MRTILTLLVVALVSAACAGDTSEATDPPADETATTAAGGDGATITIADFAFVDVPTVSVGDTVTVENTDGASHTWTSGDGVFDSGTLGSGDTFEFTFTEAGEYDFFCEIHPSMTGTITVEG